MKRFLVLILFMMAVFLSASDASHASLNLAVKADHVLIYKGQRKLKLVHENTVLREYKIALGFNPAGHKRYEGDGRTPEGMYYIDWKNPKSDFFLSLKISYPNKHDRRRAERRGERPGNMIMIHGLPNDRTALDVGHPTRDWTNGCIAVDDQEILEIWELVDEGTAVTIYP